MRGRGKKSDGFEREEVCVRREGRKKITPKIIIREKKIISPRIEQYFQAKQATRIIKFQLTFSYFVINIF